MSDFPLPSAECGTDIVEISAPAVACGRGAILYGMADTPAEQVAYEAAVRTMAIDLVRWTYPSWEVCPAWSELCENDRIIFTARAQRMFSLAGQAIHPEIAG